MGQRQSSGDSRNTGERTPRESMTEMPPAPQNSKASTHHSSFRRRRLSGGPAAQVKRSSERQSRVADGTAELGDHAVDWNRDRKGSQVVPITATRCVSPVPEVVGPCSTLSGRGSCRNPLQRRNSTALQDAETERREGQPSTLSATQRGTTSSFPHAAPAQQRKLSVSSLTGKSRDTALPTVGNGTIVAPSGAVTASTTVNPNFERMWADNVSSAAGSPHRPLYSRDNSILELLNNVNESPPPPFDWEELHDNVTEEEAGGRSRSPLQSQKRLSIDGGVGERTQDESPPPLVDYMDSPSPQILIKRANSLNVPPQHSAAARLDPVASSVPQRPLKPARSFTGHRGSVSLEILRASIRNGEPLDTVAAGTPTDAPLSSRQEATTERPSSPEFLLDQQLAQPLLNSAQFPQGNPPALMRGYEACPRNSVIAATAAAPGNPSPAGLTDSTTKTAHNTPSSVPEGGVVRRLSTRRSTVQFVREDVIPCE